MPTPRFLPFVSLLALLANVGHSAEPQTTEQKFNALKEAGIFAGLSDGQSGLDQNLTRDQFARTAALILGTDHQNSGAKTSFDDVKDSEWTAGFIGAVNKAGILEGQGDGVFDPNAQATNHQFGTMLLSVLRVRPNGAPPADDDASGSIRDYVSAVLKLRSDSAGFSTDMAPSHTEVEYRRAAVLFSVSSQVRYTASDGKTVTLDAGDGIIINEDGTIADTAKLQELIALEAQYGDPSAPGSLTNSLNTLLNQVATKVAAGELGANGPTILANVVETLTKANPSAATSYFDTAINAVAGSTALTSAQKKEATTLVSQKVINAVPRSQVSPTRLHITTALMKNRSALGGLSATDIANATKPPTLANTSSDPESRTDTRAGGDIDITIESPSS